MIDDTMTEGDAINTHTHPHSDTLISRFGSKSIGDSSLSAAGHFNQSCSVEQRRITALMPAEVDRKLSPELVLLMQAYGTLELLEGGRS